MMETLWTFLNAQTQNEFLMGGLLLALAAAAAAMLRALWIAGRGLVWRRIAWTVSLDNRGEAYGQLLTWLGAVGGYARVRRFRVDVFDGPAREGEASDGSARTLTPDQGRFWFARDGVLAMVDRRIDDKPIPGRKERLEELSLTLLSLRRDGGRRAFERWMAAAEAHGRSERDAWPRLFVCAPWGDWTSMGRARPRPLETVVTANGVGERLLADARRFLEREVWYDARGVPWRRGYLLHGPPGTGKSSLIRAVASEAGLDLAIVDLARKGLGDAELRDALANAPARAALVLEDVDAAFAGRAAEEGAGGITFSGLLNALDGLAAQEGRLVFMTTNHRARLDPALIRPGRADVHVALDLIGPREAARLFARFFPDAVAARDRLAALEAAAVRRASPAAAQAALLVAAEDAVTAETALAALFVPEAGAAPATLAAE